jgi:hypothetical protein
MSIKTLSNPTVQSEQTRQISSRFLHSCLFQALCHPSSRRLPGTQFRKHKHQRRYRGSSHHSKSCCQCSHPDKFTCQRARWEAHRNGQSVPMSGARSCSSKQIQNHLHWHSSEQQKGLAQRHIDSKEVSPQRHDFICVRQDQQNCLLPVERQQSCECLQQRGRLFFSHSCSSSRIRKARVSLPQCPPPISTDNVWS